MIVIKLIGGLGNQMFQYALGRKLSFQNQEELLLDCSFFKEEGTHTPREYELGIFHLQANIATEEELSAFQQPSGSLLSRIRNKIRRMNGADKTFIEVGHRFHPEVMELKGDLHLTGYWQSEKYFSDIRQHLLEDFVFKRPPEGKNKELLDKIQSTNSISLHIRRGDYVTNEAANSFHGLCTLDYYQSAVNHIAHRYDTIHLYVFSDDIPWAEKNLNLGFPMTFVNHNQGKSSWEDMRLMSGCQHNIIANSSFSWWGAWLNDNSNKIVVAPQRWFATKDNDNPDIIPERWIRL